jgi:hypothetical protein
VYICMCMCVCLCVMSFDIVYICAHVVRSCAECVVFTLLNEVMCLGVCVWCVFVCCVRACVSACVRACVRMCIVCVYI